jgi:hypothetical protein
MCLLLPPRLVDLERVARVSSSIILRKQLTKLDTHTHHVEVRFLLLRHVAAIATRAEAEVVVEILAASTTTCS